MSNKKMVLISHLEELRKRLIYILVMLFCSFVLSFAFVSKIFNALKPSANLGIKLTVLGPGDVVRVYFMIAGISALIMTLPFILVQIWRFLARSLPKQQHKVVLRFIPALVVMFIIGILFGWYVIFPTLFAVLIKLGTQQFNMVVTASSYFGLMTNIILPLGFFFDMPIIVMILTRVGIVSPQWLSKIRKYAHFILVLIASMISPPEFVSHLSVAIPLMLLFELSIWISKRTYHKHTLNKVYDEHHDQTNEDIVQK